MKLLKDRIIHETLEEWEKERNQFLVRAENREGEGPRFWKVCERPLPSGRPVYVAPHWEEEMDLAEFVHKCQLRSYALVGEESGQRFASIGYGIRRPSFPYRLAAHD